MRCLDKSKLTFHGRNGVAALFEGVLGETLALENGGFLDRLETDVVVRPEAPF